MREPQSTLSRTLGVAVVVLLVLVLGITVWRGPGGEATADGGASTNEATGEGSTTASEGSTTASEGSTTASEGSTTASEGSTTASEGSTTANEGSTTEGDAVEGAEPTVRLDAPRAPSAARGDRRVERTATEGDAGTPIATPVVATPTTSETSTSSTGTTMDEPGAPSGLLGVEDFDRSGEHSP
jgi:hypothetical protein